MNIVSPQTFHLLSLSKLKGVGPAALKKAAVLPGFEKMPLEELASAVPQIARSLEGGSDWLEAQAWAQTQVVAADRHSARILSAVDAEYPALLAATKDDPFIVYVQGALAKPEQRSVAIVGTREPTQHGAVVTRRITMHFGEAGWSIVSGLAIGCDGLAHQAALDCGAHTVAVMAHGLHMTAPSKHKSLAQTILASGGALVSEYPFGQAVQSQQYVKRDRTQAGMALGVVMVQSDTRGGSLYASRATLEYGRWLAVPYPTPRDMENREPKVQANLLIAEAATHERTELLRCSVPALERVIVLRNKEDYWRLAESNGVEPFGRGESAVQSVYGIATDAPVESSDATGDVFSQPGPQLQNLHVEEAAGPEVAVSTDGLMTTEGETASQAPSPASPSVGDVRASRDDRATSEVFSQPEAGDSPVVEECAPVDTPFLLAHPGELSATESVETLETSADAQSAEAVQADVTRVVERSRRVQLEVSLPKDEEVGAAFGLWVPPKIGSKDFKKWLGDSADDESVREFYARHRRLHTYLINLQRKLLSAKPPLTHDQVLALRLASEEVVFHLSILAGASVAIEAQSTIERQRILKEDWIAQGEAAGVASESGRCDGNATRSSLAADASALLSAGLKSFVIDKGSADKSQSVREAKTHRLTLRELVERLNALLLSTF